MRLVHLVHVKEAVRGTLSEGGILDVFAEHPGTLLLATAEETAAMMMLIELRLALRVPVAIVWHLASQLMHKKVRSSLGEVAISVHAHYSADTLVDVIVVVNRRHQA